MSRRQRKSFSVQQFFKNAAEVWASSPHLRSKLDFATLFSCCNCIFETVQFKQSCIMRIKVANSDKATGQLQHAGRQKQGVEPPFAGCERSVSLREVLLGKPSESGSAESLRCLPVCCSLVVALSKLPMNLS